MGAVKFLCMVLLSLWSGLTFAQDEITFTNGDKIKVKVMEIGIDSVSYQQLDSLQSTTTSVHKKSIFMILYANGSRTVFQENLSSAPTTGQPQIPSSPEQLYALGQRDAQLYYKGNGALWGSAACAVTIYGLVGSFVIGAVKPAVKPHLVSDMRLIGDPHYYQGYQKMAHRRKKGRAALGAGIGLATLPVIGLILLSSTYK